MISRRNARPWLLGLLWVLLPFWSCAAWSGTSPSEAPPPSRESVLDARWTGPMLANSAATLPQGHVLVEPYLYDVASRGSDRFGSLTYLLYGLTDRCTVGVVPVLGYNRVSNGPSSSGIGLGDTALLAQYRLVQFPAESSLPTISFQLREDLPTGRYDRLGNRPANGLGSGARITTIGLNTQTYFWLPNGRILRMRLNLAQTFPREASVDGVSVYGTPEGFRGRVRPGRSFSVDSAWEYSLSREWVLALDVVYQRNRGTVLNDYRAQPGASITRPAPSRLFEFAPAVEYNWNAHMGVLLGVRVIPGGGGRTRSITPAIAVDMVH